MSDGVTFEQVEELAAQLPLREQLRLVARICDQISAVAEVVRRTLIERRV